MSVFADTPRWPRHGTLWGHLISDDSLEELHETAARAGLHPRSFDLDHYDWPQEAQERLAAAGVAFVGNRDLTRILIASGLRIPLADRPAARRARTQAHAEELGLSRVPQDLITGLRGHVDPLPSREDAPLGAYRLGRPNPCALADIEAHDELGRLAAQEFLAEADALSQGRTGHSWVGQVLDWPVDGEGSHAG